MTEAEKILHEALARAMKFSSTIWALRRVLTHGLPQADSAITDEHRRMWDAMLRSPEGAAWLGANPRGDYGALVSYLSQTAASDARSRALAALLGSELVFYHALADVTALDCCRGLVAWDWTNCARWVEAKKVEVAQVLDWSREDIVRSALHNRLNQLSRESLLTKTDLLYAACRPVEGWSSLENYTFSRRRLEELDRWRHDVVHGLSLDRCATLLEEDITYLSLTSAHLPQLVMHHAGLVLDTEFMRAAMRG